MPRISAFYGIIISMFFDEHPPPHFHAQYGEYKAKVSIREREVIAGRLPTRALRLVREWAGQHTDELLANWAKAEQRTPPDRIEPLP
jgi:hypothetical protein